MEYYRKRSKVILTMIHTREQLINEIYKILYNNFPTQGQFDKCANEIADLIASLDDPNEDWKNVP